MKKLTQQLTHPFSSKRDSIRTSGYAAVQFTHQTEGQATQDPRLHTPHTGGTNYQNDSPVQVSVWEGSEERQLNRKLGPHTTQTPPRHAKLLRYRKLHNYGSVNFGPERLGGSQGTTTTCTCTICAATLWAKRIDPTLISRLLTMDSETNRAPQAQAWEPRFLSESTYGEPPIHLASRQICSTHQPRTLSHQTPTLS